jgi:uncharacterized membrane protein YccC
MSATVMALTAQYQADFAAFANGNIAVVAGLAGAAAVMAVVRSVGADWAAARLLRANRADIAALAARHGDTDRVAFASRMLDRLAMVVPRLAISAPGADTAATRALADVRVGWNIMALQRQLHRLPEPARRSIAVMLEGIAAQYGHPARRPGRQALLRQIDRAIAAAAAAPAEHTGGLLRSVSGLRQALFPLAPPYQPRTAPEPPDLRAAA